MSIFNKAERDRKDSRKKRREEIRGARGFVREGIGRFADLSASFYRGELIIGQANPPFVEMCANIADLLRQADAIACELELRFAPEKKDRRAKFFPKKSTPEPEVIEACRQ